MNVYVSHSAKSPIGPLRELLQQEGASFRDSFDLSASSDVSKRILSQIQTADALIAVISEEAPNVFFEIGVAIALRKPVLALVKPGTTAPSFVAPLTYLTSDLADSDVLRLGVKRFLDKSKERPSKVRHTRKELPGGLHDRGPMERWNALSGRSLALDNPRILLTSNAWWPRSYGSTNYRCRGVQRGERPRSGFCRVE